MEDDFVNILKIMNHWEMGGNLRGAHIHNQVSLFKTNK